MFNIKGYHFSWADSDRWKRDDHGRGRNWKQSPEVTAIIHDFPEFVKFNMTKQLINIYPVFCQMGTTSSLWSMWNLERGIKMWMQLTKTQVNYGEVEIPVLVWFWGQPTNKEIISVDNHLPMKKIMPTNKERIFFRQTNGGTTGCGQWLWMGFWTI